MLRARAIGASLGALVVVMLLPAITFAQVAAGAIAGTVKDTSGAVMPGVTVEASSPVLIEKVRTVVTDSHGEYKIVDLRTGTYTVTFTLSGFSTVKHEGIEVTAGVTSNASADLRVGELAETITVTAQSALVDVQNTSQHRSISDTLLDSLPTSKQIYFVAQMVPGVVYAGGAQDVGGTIGDKCCPTLAVHGSFASEMPLLFDGMKYTNVFGFAGGGSGVWVVNSGMVQELAIDTSGAGADADTAGVRVNVIPKSGGNKFSGWLFTNYSNSHLEANNLTPALAARGGTPFVQSRITDFNPAYGGPIVMDKLWFYGSYRYWGSTVQPSGAHVELTPGSPIYTPDPNVAPENANTTHAENVRFTLQTSKSSKLTLYGDAIQRCLCGWTMTATTTLDASADLHSPVNHLFQATWNWIPSSRILIEAGQTYLPQKYLNVPYLVDHNVPGALTFPSIRDTGLGVTYNSPASAGSGVGYANQTNKVENGKLTVTYVTGSHNLRFGTQWLSGSRFMYTQDNNNYTEQFLNGTPRQITEFTTPISQKESVRLSLGIFGQEQWTLKRLTMNAGLRYDHLNAGVDAQNYPTAALAPQYGPRIFPAYNDLPNFNDLSPRLGAAYDLFGNGKTAVKWNLGRFVASYGVGLAQLVNPVAASSTSTTRTWDDSSYPVGDPRRGNFVPDCDLTDPGLNGECGKISNPAFGSPALTTLFDPDAIHGWGKRQYNWETMAGIQHQLLPGLSMDISYNRRWFGNFLATVNTGVSPSDFDQYCVTTPVDTRLPGGGGQQICGLYDVSPLKFGAVGSNNLLITSAAKYGDMSMIYNGVDVNFTARLPRKIVLQGGTSTGRTALNDCGVLMGHPEITAAGTSFLSAGTGFYPLSSPTVPRATPFCDIAPPFLTDLKLQGSYPLPWLGLQASATLQSRRTPQEGAGGFPGILANWSYTSAQALPTLGRNLTSGTANIQIVPPGTLYGQRLNQVDFRLIKNLVIGRTHIQPQFDLYNLFNVNTILTYQTAYSTTGWQNVTGLEPGRYAKFGVQITF